MSNTRSRSFTVETRRLGARPPRNRVTQRQSGRGGASPSWEDPTLDALVRLLPQAFMPRGRYPRPLMLGIDGEIVAKHGAQLREALDLAPDTSADHLTWLVRRALHHYTHQPWYQIAIIKNTHRVNLKGEAAAQISRQEKEKAQTLLQEGRLRG